MSGLTEITLTHEIRLFYHVSIVVCLGIVYEYESILVILIDTIF
jgi:hypothetical protein